MEDAYQRYLEDESHGNPFEFEDDYKHDDDDRDRDRWSDSSRRYDGQWSRDGADDDLLSEC